VKIFRKKKQCVVFLAKWPFKRGIFEKKVRGSCALPGADMQKPYIPKCGQGKTKIDLFRDFLQKSPMSKL
jgi:hypothetical protein